MGFGWVGRGELDAPLHVLSVHFIQQRRGVSGDGHGRALDHRAGRRPRRHPLRFLPPLCLLLLQPLLRHLAPVHRRGAAATGPIERRREAGLVTDRVEGRHIDLRGHSMVLNCEF